MNEAPHSTSLTLIHSSEDSPLVSAAHTVETFSHTPTYPLETFPLPSPTSCPSSPYCLSSSLSFTWTSLFLDPLPLPYCTLFPFHSAGKYLTNTRNLQIQIYWATCLLGFLEGVEDEEAVTCHQATGLQCLSICSTPPGPLPWRCHGLLLPLTPPHIHHSEPSYSWHPGPCSSLYQVPRYLSPLLPLPFACQW